MTHIKTEITAAFSYFCVLRLRHFLKKSVDPHWPYMAGAETLTPSGITPGVASGFYRLMTVHPGTVTSEIVSLHL